MNTIVRVPAIRGRMGGRTYFTVSMKLKTVPRFFEFQNYKALVPEERAQRVLNKQRIPAIRAPITSFMFSPTKRHSPMSRPSWSAANL